MKYLLPFLLLCCLTACQSPETTQSNTSDKTPSKNKMDLPKIPQLLNYHAFLEIDAQTLLPFQISKKKNDDFIRIRNGLEIIHINDFQLTGDSLIFTMPVFFSQVKARFDGDNLVGIWNKMPNSQDYQMPFYAFSTRHSNIIPPRFTDYTLKAAAKNKELGELAGKWAVRFSPDVEGEYPAIGEFQQEQNHIMGTFLTETGDYRFLGGKIYGNQFYLSCFDGSHAFLFKGQIDGDNINGTFWSGNKWQEPWTAQRNPNAKLGDPYELTVVEDAKTKIDFSFSDLNGNPVQLSDERFENKNVVIQIFGSWCPNCMDEMRFYKEIYPNYQDDTEFVGIAYERNGALEKDQATLSKYITEMDIPYPILYGGKASKALASKHFPMLNKIISFPTTIVLNKKHEVVKIHTGFNGPATSVYQTYTQSFKQLLKELN